jgi:hypothetical protein
MIPTPIKKPMTIDKFNTFYNATNNTERYLWSISIIGNYGLDLLKLFDKFIYKRIFIGSYFDTYSKSTTEGFFVVLDVTRNDDFKSNIKSLINRLKKSRSLYIGNIVNSTSITLILKTGLSKEQMNYFFNSDYSKIYKSTVTNKYPRLHAPSVLEFYRLKLNSNSNEMDTLLKYNNTWLILQQSPIYFEHFIKPSLKGCSIEMINRAKSSEYDAAINTFEEMYNNATIKLLNSN